jgi:hypothetical protein
MAAAQLPDNLPERVPSVKQVELGQQQLNRLVALTGHNEEEPVQPHSVFLVGIIAHDRGDFRPVEQAHDQVASLVAGIVGIIGIRERDRVRQGA